MVTYTWPFAPCHWSFGNRSLFYSLTGNSNISIFVKKTFLKINFVVAVTGLEEEEDDEGNVEDEEDVEDVEDAEDGNSFGVTHNEPEPTTR